MNRNDVVNKIKNCVSFVTAINVQKLDENNSLRKYYKLDCFELGEIAMGVKDRFDIDSIKKQYENVDTIGEIADVVMQYGNI